MSARPLPRTAVVVMLFVVAATLVASSASAQAVPIVPRFPSCIPEKGNSVIFATLTPQTGWASVRTYFRKTGSHDWYWVEARNEGRGVYWGVLPRPEDYTKAVDMQVVARDADGKETKTPIEKVDVTSSCEPTFTQPQNQMAQNLVVGETIVEQRGQEIFGFVCPGVISRVDYTGELKPDEYCRKAAVAAAAQWPKGVIIPALAAIGGAGVAYAIVDDCDCGPESPSRP